MKDGHFSAHSPWQVLDRNFFFFFFFFASETLQGCLKMYSAIQSLNHLAGKKFQFSSVHSLSHVQLLATPWTVEHQTSLVLHQLPELAQIHVHQHGEAIQPSHPRSSPSPPTFNLSQHQGLFQ